jgi:TRAP-type mannitol/chloroaromatic compound transport system substrate-binding protein
MQDKPTPDNDAANLLFNQALVVVVEITKAQAIVELAFNAAEVSMSAMEQHNHTKLLEVAKETLRISRHTATEILKNAKKETEELLQQANRVIGD